MSIESYLFMLTNFLAYLSFFLFITWFNNFYKSIHLSNYVICVSYPTVVVVLYKFYFIFIYLLPTANEKHDNERFNVEQECKQARREKQQKFHAANQQKSFTVIFESSATR